MDSSSKANSSQHTERDSEYGEPGFVFTDYDRGARKSETGDMQSRNEETAETESHRPQD